VKVFKKNRLLSKPKQADLSENLETIISENKEQFIMKKSTLVKATMGAVLLLTTGIFSVTNVNSSQAHSANQKLRYGQTYKLVNGYDNWQGGYLDTRGRGCSENLLCVSTANNPNRDNGSGSWKILSKTGKTGVVESLDDVYLQNQYEQGAGGYLDTRGRNCSENLLCVSTANNPNRDSGSGTWKIISKYKSSNDLREDQPVQLVNGYGNGQGGYLDTRGRGCDGNLLCVSTAAGADRDSGSGTWKFIKH
jgi:hypothetical protein